jgi:hypothetical protein
MASRADSESPTIAVSPAPTNRHDAAAAARAEMAGNARGQKFCIFAACIRFSLNI